MRHSKIVKQGQFTSRAIGSWLVFKAITEAFIMTENGLTQQEMTLNDRKFYTKRVKKD